MEAVDWKGLCHTSKNFLHLCRAHWKQAATAVHTKALCCRLALNASQPFLSALNTSLPFLSACFFVPLPEHVHCNPKTSSITCSWRGLLRTEGKHSYQRHEGMKETWTAKEKKKNGILFPDFSLSLSWKFEITRERNEMVITECTPENMIWCSSTPLASHPKPAFLSVTCNLQRAVQPLDKTKRLYRHLTHAEVCADWCRLLWRIMKFTQAGGGSPEAPSCRHDKWSMSELSSKLDCYCRSSPYTFGLGRDQCFIVKQIKTR